MLRLCPSHGKPDVDRRKADFRVLVCFLVNPLQEERRIRYVRPNENRF